MGKQERADDNGVPLIVISAEWPRAKDKGATEVTGRIAKRLITEMSTAEKVRRRTCVKEFFGDNARRKTVSSGLSKIGKRHGLVVFYGHGCPDGKSLLESITRLEDEEQPLFDFNNCDELVGKIVYVVACHSAKKLGPHAVSRGAKSYIGYDNKIAIGYRGIEFLGLEECLNAGLYSLAFEEGSCADAYAAILQRYRNTILKHLIDGRTIDALGLGANRDALKMLGTQDASLYITGSVKYFTLKRNEQGLLENTV